MNKDIKILFDNNEEIFANCHCDINEEIISEIVFNTAMTGYQETFTDPSYCGQAVIMTYPLIGNYGINQEVNQHIKPTISALFTKECDINIINYLSKYNIPVFTGIDTRYLTHKIRNCEISKCLIAGNADSMQNRNSDINKLKAWKLDTIQTINSMSIKKKVFIKGTNDFHIAMLDCGIKHGIISEIAKLGISMTILPFETNLNEFISNNKVDAVFLSNGSGDPRDLSNLIDDIKSIIGKIPIYGICLGNQILGLALGCEIYKMPFGHRGANQPAINIKTKKVILTSQNHSYAIKKDSIPDNVEVSYINLNDETIEGIECKEFNIKSVQFHPEANPGTNDAKIVFQEWFGNV